MISDGALLEVTSDGSARRVADAGLASEVLGSPDGRTAVLASGGSMTLIDVASGRGIAEVPSGVALEGCERLELERDDAGAPAPWIGAPVFRAWYRPDGRALAVTCFVDEPGTVTRARMRAHVIDATHGRVLASSGECATTFFAPGGCLELRLNETCPSNWRDTPLARGAAWSVHDPATGARLDDGFMLPDESPVAVLRDGTVLVGHTIGNLDHALDPVNFRVS